MAPARKKSFGDPVTSDHACRFGVCRTTSPTWNPTMHACAEYHPAEHEPESSRAPDPERARELREQMKAFLDEIAQVEASLIPIRAEVTRNLAPPGDAPNIFEQP